MKLYKSIYRLNFRRWMTLMWSLKVRDINTRCILWNLLLFNKNVCSWFWRLKFSVNIFCPSFCWCCFVLSFLSFWPYLQRPPGEDTWVLAVHSWLPLSVIANWSAPLSSKLVLHVPLQTPIMTVGRSGCSCNNTQLWQGQSTEATIMALSESGIL